MDALQRKQRGLYASARDALSEWESVQSALASLVGTACNILPRLRLLAQVGAFAGLDAGHMLPELCRRKQMAALDSVLRSAHEQARAVCARAVAVFLLSRRTQLAALTAVVHRLEKLAADGSALLQARPLFAVSRLQLTLAPQGLRPPPAQGGGVRHGGEPSLADGVEARLAHSPEHGSR